MFSPTIKTRQGEIVGHKTGVLLKSLNREVDGKLEGRPSSGNAFKIAVLVTINEMQG